MAANIYPSFSTLSGTVSQTLAEQTQNLICRDPVYEDYNGGVEKVFILLYAARSGSTFASQSLSAHPDFGRMTAWLEPRRIEKTRVRYGVASHSEAISIVLKENRNSVFGYKANIADIFCSAYLGLLDRFRKSTTILILRRRDTVAQAVSLFKGRLSGQFSSNQKPLRKVELDDFDYDVIAAHKKTIEDVYKLHERALDALGINAPTIFYEDIIIDPQAFVNAVADEMGLPNRLMQQPNIRLKKISDEINHAWIDMFNANLTFGG